MLWLFSFGLGEEVGEVLLPDGGLGVGAVAASGIGDGDEDELGVGYLCDHFFCDAQLGWVDEIVGRVDPEDRGGDVAESGAGL